jgi:hypothetical protein
MKITMLTCMAVFFCYLQNGTARTTPLQDSVPKTNFFLKNGNLYYQKVFYSDLNQKELSDKVVAHLGKVYHFRFKSDNNASDSEFTGYLTDYNFKIGRNASLGISTMLMKPMDAMVVVQVKDAKYRITISDMAFMYAVADSVERNARRYPIESDVTENEGTQIKKPKYKMISIIDYYFTDLFDLKNAIISTEF